MKHNYAFFRRYVFMCVLASWLATLAGSVLAQQRGQYDAGIIRFKASESLAQQLESVRVTKNGSNEVVTGIQALDIANAKIKATAIKRVFPDAGKNEARHRRYGLHLWYEVRMDKATSVLAALAAYQSIDRIEVVEPSHKKAIIGSDKPGFGPRVVSEKELAGLTLPGASNDPLLANQWHYNNTGQAGGTPGSDIKLFQAWGITTGTPNVIVGVTDGGAQVNHPDLAANMWVNTGEIPGNNIDDDNNGYVDDVNGYGFGDDTGVIAPDEHGTHTSGTIAAVSNNGVGVAGVAGGSGTGDGVRIMSLAAFGATANGGFEDTYVYGADNGAIISQNSWGYTSAGVFEQVVLDAIDYFIAEAGKDENGVQTGPMRGGIVIFAAGNDDTQAAHYPGFYDHTLAVAGVNNQDKKGWYSNYGTWVDIAAPGGETFVNNDPKGVLSTISGSQYAYFQGTSMACPHVSGVAALIISKYGGQGFTPEMLRGRLTQLVDDIDAADPEFAGLLGSGRLNAFKALQQDDGNAPEVITNLTASAAAITSVTLTWTSPLDSGNASASVYDIRYSTSPITPANFAAATAVPNPPAPKPAGSTETLTITGLLPGTTYYFAIKSADFFGNYSDISNVLVKATNFPPVIGVSPATISASLKTAETVIRNLTIANTGKGILNYSFEGITPQSIARPTPVSGSVAANASVVIPVKLDANHLLAGTYTQTLFLTSNDPVKDTVEIPVTLTVISNGKPIASVEPDSLNFGDVFVTGSKTLEVSVYNAGAEPLIITGATFSDSNFTTVFDGTDTIAAFQHLTIPVKFTSSALGPDDGTLSLQTNDATSAILTVWLIGNGVPAPNIEVTPASLSASLNTNKSTTRTLTVKNTGGSNLDFSVAVASPSVSAVSSSRKINVPSRGAVQSGAAQKQLASGNAKFRNEITLRSVGKSAVVSKVLILTADEDASDIETVLDAFDDIEADIFPKDSLPTIKASSLAPYDVVFTTNNTQWLGAGGVDPEVIGDVLADYIDGGGKVIANQFAYSYDAWKMAGRFIDDDYGPFEPSTTDENIDVELGDILVSNHPLVKGVSSLSYSGYVQNVSLAAGATAVAEWENGELLLAANANVVALNLLPSLGNGDPLQWEGDLPLIYQNAVHYLVGPTNVTVDPTAGTVAAGAQLDLTVTFDASGLEAGVYNNTINITSNAPNEELVAVPAVLTVLGPEFTVQPDSLYEELEKGETSVKTIVLKNNGPDNHAFTVKVQGGTIVSSVLQKSSAAATGVSAARPEEKRRELASSRRSADYTSTAALQTPGRASARKASAKAGKTAATNQYATDFESFDLGDITGQEDWAGQFGNWTIEAENPFSAAQHFRGLADGLGQSLAASAGVPIGSDPKSTFNAKVNVTGTGVTWQLIPQSPSAGSVVTRIQFGPDGKISALVPNGSAAKFVQIGTTPTGYFDLTVEADRDSATFKVFVNNDEIFAGQGFAGDIEEVYFLSLMEEEGPTLDVDDFKIIDGVKPQGPSFISATPLSGNLPSGASATIQVKFDATVLDFGTYEALVKIDVDGYKLNVPATLAVVGDPDIKVSPTVLLAEVDYKEDTTHVVALKNTGGRPLTYSLQVLGASTDVNKVPVSPVSRFKAVAADQRVTDKLSKDASLSKPVVAKNAAVKVLAGSALLQEDFEDATFPPSGWTVKDNAGEGVIWDFAAAYGEGNYAGTGEAATASSDAFGEAEFDTELISPLINTTGFKNIAVQYNASYQNFANLDFLNLDIEVNGTWTTALSWNEDHGTLRGSGEFVTVPLDSYLNGATTFRLRWHYFDPNDDDFDWYAQVDDIVVLGDARAWLTVNPASGTVPVQGTALIDAHFDAEDIAPGSYVAGVVVRSNSVSNPLVGIVASLKVNEPAKISVAPASLNQELLIGNTATQTLTISNSGKSALKYAFGNAPVPDAVPASGKARIVSDNKRTTREPAAANLLDTRAIAATAASKKATTPLYVTGFEDFTTGDVNGQDGWAGQFSNWTIESEDAFEGALHLRGLADGLGTSRAFSPTVAIGTEDISSAALQVKAEAGVTWQIIPQSPTAQFVNTRVQIAPDRSLSVLAKDAAGNSAYVPVNATLPEGYFNFRIDVQRATSIFTIYIDNVAVFEGLGFAGNIEQIVLFSLMEADGPVFDIDNLAIYDGAAAAPWLSYNPKSGIVPPGGSAKVTVVFDASDLEEGIYTDSLNISSNDPAKPLVIVPVTLKVEKNNAPVVTPVTATVVELSSQNITFTATDVEGDAVTIVLHENLPFITKVSSANGTATYSVKPVLGNAGQYSIPLVATDARGAKDSVTFKLTVLPYGIQSLSLYNVTNQAIVSTADTLVYDVAQPGITQLNVLANVAPAKVGSVRFWIDGKADNLESEAPYNVNITNVQALAAGYHTIKAEAYTLPYGGGVKTNTRTAVLLVKNSGKITALHQVDNNGRIIRELADSVVLNGGAGSATLNFLATTSGSAVRSVVFKVNGVVKAIDNTYPYWVQNIPPVEGFHTLEVIPYSNFDARGIAGQSKVVVIEVAGASASAAARRAGDISPLVEKSFTMYPVPVADELTISFTKKVEGPVSLLIHDAQGRSLHRKEGVAETFREYKVSTQQIGIISGEYYVQFIHSNGQREVSKLVKE